MRSIQALFEKVRTQNPEWSDFICFAEAITNKGFSRDRIGRAFNKFVPKNDCPDSRKTIMNFLVGLSSKVKRGVRTPRLKSPTNDFSTEKHKSTTSKKVR